MVQKSTNIDSQFSDGIGDVERDVCEALVPTIDNSVRTYALCRTLGRDLALLGSRLLLQGV